MFSRKKKDLMKTPSISKKHRTGSPIPQNASELPRKDAVDIQVLQMGSSSELTVSNIPTSKLGNSPSTASTLKRPTNLSRHASAAGFPISNQTSTTTWGFSKGNKFSMYSGTESCDGPVMEAEDIAQLLRHVARFAEGLEKLKDVVLGEDKQDTRRPMAHECLGEVLRILRQVINKYPILNSVETLTAAGTLISKVKGFHYESSNEADKKEFEKAVETIAVAFSSIVSEFLMGEVDSSTLLSLPPADKSRSMENLYGGLPTSGDMVQTSCELINTGSLTSEQVDIMLQKYEGGVEAALQYAKAISKYMKDLSIYLEKRTTLEMEFAKGLQKMVQSCKASIMEEHYMPFLSIYSLALEQDMDYGQGVMQMANTLQNQTFLQPLLTRRVEHEKKRKELKELWHRAQKKLQEAEGNLRKSKQVYMQRHEEYEKAKYVTGRAEEDQQSASSSNTTKTLEKKRRLEEEAKNKATEAEATYRTCVADAKTQKQELEDVKVNVLRQIQEVIKQTDQTLKSATISYYQIMHMQTAPLPVHYQTLCESSKLYDPAQQYACYVKELEKENEQHNNYDFEPYVPQVTWSPYIRTRKGSFNAHDYAAGSGSETPGGTQSPVEEITSLEGAILKENRNPERRGGRGHQVHKSWPTGANDADSTGSGSCLNTPSGSSGDLARKIPLMSSDGTMSSNEEIDEKDGNTASFEQSINGISSGMDVPTGPFRNVGLSKAAQTHRMRKLRTPSKCRECDSYVYFQGAECEECYLACHKKCLESLAIQCGHKKLHGKLQLFGRDFEEVSKASPDGIPFIIKKCISEIEKRASKIKGIYRVNGVKTRVEKLCQAFENGKELVELSQASPHDISNVLKLYLRQLPEPIMPFRLYNELMGLAKESLHGSAEGVAGKGPELVDKGPDTNKEVIATVQKLIDLLKELPPSNMATLQYLIRHLCRIAELEQDNKMTPSNLGIVFGPTLMRPRPTEATVSLSSLVDYPHQARILETMIIFYDAIFESRSTDCLLNADSDNGGQGNNKWASTGQRPASGNLDDVAEEEYISQQLQSEDATDNRDSFCGNSLGSTGSRERSIDSDSELEDGNSEYHNSRQMKSAKTGSRLIKQGSETSAEEGQLYSDGNEGSHSRTSSLEQTSNRSSSINVMLQQLTIGEHGELDNEVITSTSEVKEVTSQRSQTTHTMTLSQYNTNQSNSVLKISHCLSDPLHYDHLSPLVWRQKGKTIALDKNTAPECV
ncbi:rho GTPase-activating protein 45 isoform X2 [Protopterus annectens]|uniref:rho GTPase-activating protein 45 isoform X2 n=1 Tax=Protopterus annectens TaxID=7888 RepID=UPI001CFB3A20|nr:rho GTPase-activating protein 45 isoform X2 [Protopterus annectens]